MRLVFATPLLILAPAVAISLYACSDSGEHEDGEDSPREEANAGMEEQAGSQLSSLSSGELKELCLSTSGEDDVRASCEYTAVLAVRNEASDQDTFESLCETARDECVEAVDAEEICGQEINLVDGCSMTLAEFRQCKADVQDVYRSWGDCTMAIADAKDAPVADIKLPCIERYLSCLES